MPIKPRKEKSLFNGTTKSSLIRNNRAVQYLPSVDTRYFRRLYKRQGAEGFLDVLNKFTQHK